MADAWRQTATLTISNGETASEVLDFSTNSLNVKAVVLIMAPATLPETVNIQIAAAPSGTFGILRSGGSAIVLSAGSADQICPVVAGAIKLVATGAVGDDRVFTVIAQPM